MGYWGITPTSLPCFLCAGQRKIEIGRNLDNKSENLIECPACDGKGYIKNEQDMYYNSQSLFWKRLKEKGYEDYRGF